jgi:phosphopantetheinyl transferase (holo-ACP synthase)
VTDREVVSLREYFEKLLIEYDLRYQQRFDASQEGIKAALQAAKEAVVKAEVAMEKRFDNTNEWRHTYDDLAQRKLGREEYITAHKVLEEKITQLQKRVDTKEGSNSGIGVAVSTGIAVAAVLATVWLALHR